MIAKALGVMAETARHKSDFLSARRTGYCTSAVMAGFHVGFASLLLLTIGGVMGPHPMARIFMGASFAIALSLVVIAGSDLYTGNNMTMTGGAFCRTVSWREAGAVWIVSNLGNWAGSALLAAIFWGSGLASGDIGAFAATLAAAKMNVPPFALFLRGILCNMLVCLGVWCAYRCVSESGKLIMVFWCIYAFVTCGFEHSVANMSLLTVGLLAPHGPEVAFSGYVYNIVIVSLGNLAGGALFVAAPYFVMGGGNCAKPPLKR